MNAPARISRRRSIRSVAEIRWADKLDLLEIFPHQQVQLLARFRGDAVGLGDDGIGEGVLAITMALRDEVLRQVGDGELQQCGCCGSAP